MLTRLDFPSHRSKSSTPDASRLGRLGAAILCSAALASCGGAELAPRKSEGSAPSERPSSPEQKVEFDSPESAWLSRVGTGAQQTARVCSKGAKDRIAMALCSDEAAAIRGLSALYEALGLGPTAPRLMAATTHSLALSARIVSALNPRVFVFENTRVPNRPFSYEQIVSTAFSRGEQFVELVALDPATYDYNFYLLKFEQECNRSRCTPEDLLTEKVEKDWTGWTLYSDSDLVDTPLDCLSCHLPFGAGTHKQLLMRQVIDPWMHWGDFRGGDEGALCPEIPQDGHGAVVVTADGLDALLALETPEGHYGGLPVDELHAAKSGEQFVAFVANSGQDVRNSPYAGETPYRELAFQTREVLCERFHTGTSPTWEKHQQEARARGLPVPYFGPDILDPEHKQEVLADRAGFLAKHQNESAFDVAKSLIAEDVAASVGFLPSEDASAQEILQGMCFRCHDGSAEPTLRRSRFNVTSLDSLEPGDYEEIMARLTAPKGSAELMPPLRVGELPGWAIERVADYLRQRCSNPNACR